MNRVLFSFFYIEKDYLNLFYLYVFIYLKIIYFDITNLEVNISQLSSKMNFSITVPYLNI